MKQESFKENLGRLLSENEDPVGEQGTPVENRSVPDRLWVLRERIKELRSEAEDLSSLLEYHSGSRLSQVVDVLTQAERLTEETMSQTNEFKVIDRGTSVEIWDKSVGVGIGFRKGDGDSRRHLLFIRSDENDRSGDDDLIEQTYQNLISFAESRFPQEFRLRIIEDDKTRTIWDESVGIGLRFEIGDRLARYRLTYIVRDRSILTTDEGMRLLTETRERLLSFAENNFEEFIPRS